MFMTQYYVLQPNLGKVVFLPSGLGGLECCRAKHKKTKQKKMVKCLRQRIKYRDHTTQKQKVEGRQANEK